MVMVLNSLRHRLVVDHDRGMSSGAPGAGQSVLLGDLTYAEVGGAASSGAIAVVPTGCTEQQGPHLPVDFDTWLVTTVAFAAAERARADRSVKVLVTPTLPFGPTPEHRSFGSGFVDLPQSVHEEVISAVLGSLHDQGFRRLVIWRGCGGHDLSRVVAAFNGENEGCVVHQPELPYRDIWLEHGDPRDEGGHADGFATSLALHLRPELVRQDRIADPNNDPVDWDDPALDFGRYSSTGVIGRPTVASADFGARIWNEVIRRSADILTSISHGQ